MKVMDTPLHHLFIMYHDGEKMIVYRGGPENGGNYAALAAEGRATEYNSDGAAGDGRDAGDRDYGLGRLVVHRRRGRRTTTITSR